MTPRVAIGYTRVSVGDSDSLSLAAQGALSALPGRDL